jgi:hypothetical protein
MPKSDSPCSRVASFAWVLSAAISFLGAAFSSASPALAAGGQTGNLSGTLVDAQTKAPLEGASISAASPSGTYAAKSDARGFFSILGMTVDTYVVSLQAQGYDTLVQSGVTVVGDQTVGLGAIGLQRRLRTIGKVTARSRNSAFQPTQTVDSVTVSGARITQTTGKAASTDEQSLILAVPGTSVTNTGAITIRGGLATEVGYQFDGVDYTEPFFATSATNGKFNGLGALQVVEGAGDATQGNVGGGVVNIIPKRGARPPFGMLDAEAWAPNFGHQAALEYGFATPSGRLSEYIAYNGQRDAPYLGYHASDAASYGNFYGTSYEANDDIVSNLIYRFGRNNDQSLQILYQNRDLQQWGNVGGLAGQAYYLFDPASYSQATEAPGVAPPLGYAFCTTKSLSSSLPPCTANLALFQRLIGLAPGVPATNRSPSGPELNFFNPTRFLKFEYTRSINSTTYLALRTYNWNTLQGGYNNLQQGSALPNWQQSGGGRSGVSSELTKQLSAKHTLTLAAKFENQHPTWDDFDPYSLAEDLVFNTVSAPNLAGGAGRGVPSSADFIPAVNGICPLTMAPPGPAGCYLSRFFPNGVPRIPVDGINYNRSDFQVFGLAVRDQWAPNARLRFDLGLREDGANYKVGAYPLNPDLNNPADVPPSYITNDQLRPRVTEPRAAASYQMGRNDALRMGFGRSVVFANAQTFGTPAALYNYQAFLSVPPLDHAGVTSPACGSGTNTSRHTPVVISGAPPTTSNLFYCQNYAQSLFWLYDQFHVAPDVGSIHPATYLNYDLTYQHQFRDGVGLRITPFYKRASSLPSFSLISQVLDPTTGQILSQVFNSTNLGVNRTTGVEFGLTTPDRETGLSGFLSVTYQNVFNSTPPLIGGEDSLPINSSGSLALGDLYRAGYVSPFLARLGFELKTSGGWRFNPILQFDRGYPYGVGTTIASNQVINGRFYNIPQVNLGPGITQIPGYTGVTGSGLATQFVDPAYPGSIFNPNIAATRGTPETSQAGGVLSKPELNADVSVEWTRKRNTLGVLIQNVFGNVYYGSHYQVNPYYQPVTNGVAGPQTGLIAQANPAFEGGIFRNRGFANIPADAFGRGAYIMVPNAPMQLQFYYQRSL